MSPVLFRTVRLWLHIALIFALLQSALSPIVASSIPFANTENEQRAGPAGPEWPAMAYPRTWLAGNRWQEGAADDSDMVDGNVAPSQGAALYLPQISDSGRTEQLQASDVVTATLESATTPEGPATPEITAAPEATASPIVSATATVTATLEVTATPEVTATLEITVTPQETATPVITTTAIVTATPEVTLTPVVSTTPEITATPAVTATPEVPEAPIDPEAEPAPVIVRVSARKTVLTPNSATQLTVQVEPLGDADVAGLTVALTLPDWLSPVGGGSNAQLTWTLPALGSGETFTERVVVKAPKAKDVALPVVNAVQAAVFGDEVGPAVSELLMAVIERRGNPSEATVEAVQSVNGTALTNSYEDVSLLVPPESAQPGTVFIYTRGYDWQEGGGSESPPTSEVGGIETYKYWEMDADLNGVEVEGFEEPVLVDLDVSALVQQGVNGEELRVLSRDNADDAWAIIESEYDPIEQHVRAWFPHFSDGAVAQDSGIPVETSGGQLPNVKAFTVSELYGSAAINYAIEAPAGLGGLTPGLSLSYSSQSVDNLYREALVKGDVNKIYTQASPVGLGWNLNGISYIVRTDGDYGGALTDADKRYSLVLNGQSMALFNVEGRWGTDPEIFARITHEQASSGPHGFGQWVITITDGTTYRFGDLTYGGDTTPDATSESATLYSNGQRRTVRWYLREVEDPQQNRMLFKYRNEWDWEHEGISSDIEETQGWYTRQILPDQILWSGQSEGSMRIRVSFAYASGRTDIGIEGTGLRDRTMPWYTDKRLSAMTVEVRHSDGQWRTLRGYHLTPVYRAGDRRLHLANIAHKGEDGGTLQTYSFSYEDQGNSSNRDFLKTANNGWGGAITFIYGAVHVTCDTSSCGSDQGLNKRPVFETQSVDGIGNSYRVTYRYDVGANHGHLASGSGQFLGFADATISTYDTNSQTNIVRIEFVENACAQASGLRSDPDPRCGRVKQRTVSDGSGHQLSQEVSVWLAFWYRNGGWETNGDVNRASSRYQTDSGPVTPPMWVRLEQTVSQVDGAVNRSDYEYRTTHQGNQQFGNVTHVKEYADNVLQRQTVTEYANGFYAPPGKYMVNLPGRVRTLDAGGACAAETRMIYADSTNYAAQATGNQPIRVQRAVNCSECAVVQRYGSELGGHPVLVRRLRQPDQGEGARRCAL